MRLFGASAVVFICLLALERCAVQVESQGGEKPAASTQAGPPLFEGLGSHARKINTSSPQAQAYFNQGLNFLFAFNHDEAIRAFRQAAQLDPNCAMAYWGVAIANGPHINNIVVPPPRAKAAWDAVGKAGELSSEGDGVERAMIEALKTRYADPQPEDRKPLDAAYASAMRKLWKQYPDDADIGALFAESLMDLRPWDLWSEGKPRPETPEILETLEAVFERAPGHPLAAHLYVHAVEASPNPAKADAAADRLRTVAPGLGHLVHMPSHIDIRRGRWTQAIRANELAIAADTRYHEQVPEQGFYRLYMTHNRHMLAFAAIMTGQSERGLGAVRGMLAQVPPQWLEKKENAMIADGFMAMPIEVLVRFGRWKDVLAEPEPPEQFPVARALRHAARSVAQAALDDVAAARTSQKAFREAAAKTPKEAFFGNNAAADLFAVADALVEGEILLRENKLDEALAALRQAVKHEDALRYDEPPDWIQPVRHTLGVVYLQANKPEEAERAYREDLVRWPENGWSLYGLARSLEAQGKRDQAAEVKARFGKAWAHADVELSSSCFCQPNPE